MDNIGIVLTLFVIAFTGGVIGFELGAVSVSEREKEIIELSIELTTLEIKKLKGACNG